MLRNINALIRCNLLAALALTALSALTAGAWAQEENPENGGEETKETEQMPLPQLDCLCPEAPPEEPGSPVPPTEPFKEPPIKPTLCDFLKAKPVAQEMAIQRTDPLLRPPFAGQPVDTVKGLAAGIRAIELDAQNRILAVQYLGTVDCVTYPQAKEMLIQTMLEDPQEEVRYEAVLALRMMLTRGYDPDQDVCECEGCCDRRRIVEETQRHAERAKRQAPKKHEPLPAKIGKLLKAPAAACKKRKDVRKNGPMECRRYDWCRGCCGARALQALTKVAYDTDAQGCPLEPSARVRQAALEGLCLCPCTAAYPTYAVPMPEPTPRRGGEEVPQLNPADEGTPPPVPPSDASRRAMKLQLAKAQTPSAPEVAALNGYCIVSLQNKQFVPGKAEFTEVFEGRTYHFSTAAARDEFRRYPEGYAPAYSGADPVERVDRGVNVEGKYLRLHDGRFYLFASKDNWNVFKQNPERYTPTEVETVSGSR